MLQRRERSSENRELKRITTSFYFLLYSVLYSVRTQYCTHRNIFYIFHPRPHFATTLPPVPRLIWGAPFSAPAHPVDLDWSRSCWMGSPKANAPRSTATGTISAARLRGPSGEKPLPTHFSFQYLLLAGTPPSKFSFQNRANGGRVIRRQARRPIAPPPPPRHEPIGPSGQGRGGRSMEEQNTQTKTTTLLCVGN